MARVLEPDPPGAAREECPADDALRLRVAVGDDDPIRLGDNPADPAEIVGEGPAQRLDPAWIAITEIGIGHPVYRVAQATQPLRAREARNIRGAWTQVEPRGRVRDERPARRRQTARCRLGDARSRALAQGQVALGGELRVGADDDAAGDPELAGEIPGRVHARAGAQPPVADGAAQLGFDLRTERA